MPLKVPLLIVDCVAHCFTKLLAIQQKLTERGRRRSGDWKGSDILRTVPRDFLRATVGGRFVTTAQRTVRV